MDHFEIKNGEVHAENIALSKIADEVGTPCYVYSKATLVRHARVFADALSHLPSKHIAFAIKANPNLAVLRVMANEGYGADVVSAGELARALAAGMAAEDIVFSGVGKSRAEMDYALEQNIGQFNIESEDEGVELSAVALAQNKVADCVLRINPDVDAGTHAKISTGKSENKFGVPIHWAEEIFDRLAKQKGLNLRGLALHIGSQLSDLKPLEIAFTKIGELVKKLRANGHMITHVDLGGGLGVPYRKGEILPSPAEYGEMVGRVCGDWNVCLMFEPGRVIPANAGVLLTRVIRVKRGMINPFVVVDAAMNDLARPSLYDAWHDFDAICPNGQRMTANIVGPICETGDTFAMGRDIDEVKSGDLAIFRTAGAYGATMASTYNSRPMVPETLVDGDRYAIVANRIEPQAILAEEQVPEWLMGE
ncbi:diaminopimelate decarboxylase [Sphingorhabdus lutea]|uniref:Diaminopimelate decarboxylase n=1 Tax=Sphingorhabdus lutea TaxID=1913578 RepID=A0A1L3JAF5_9SPHN|nr:diaminopimelate decarboxylase [Sphingorhabdus lutea]APG62114.1 diaminopimelate decarboxylase [Sphingorhabdus lutea]